MTTTDDILKAGESTAGVSRRANVLEVSVFLFLIVPSLVLSFFAVKQGSVSFALTAVSTILRDLALVSLILYFVWRNREGTRSLGWTFRNFWKDVLIGVVLFVPVNVGTSYLDQFLQSIGFSAPSTPLPATTATGGIGQIVLGVILVIIVAIAEETIFRGYLILRFKRITTSAAWAVIISSFIFSLGHGYEGTSGVVTVGVMGAIFAVIYLWRQSLTAPMVMHFLQDFLGIVLLPLLGLGS
ncbi:MAG: type II CAAX endopeptidase family protein [Anaerolineae bacterium]